MPFCDLPDVRLYYTDEGPKDGPVVMFANSLGTTTAMWDQMVSHLPAGLRIIRYDKRGHGQSDVPKPPYSMGTLIKDVEGLIEHLAVRDIAFVGLSIGGMIAQGLATKRPDLIKAMVLSNTGARIGTRQMWKDRIQEIRALGMKAMAPQILQRWFSPKFLANNDVQPWHDMLASRSVDGYTGCAAAIQGTDFISPTSVLRLPVLCIAGGMDQATPADMVRETCDLIEGAQMKVLPNSGHIPAIDAPERYAEILTAFLRQQDHLP
ncbi:MAG: 3-oxoadipate enol-lactonase [Planktomarina sp.]